MFAQQTIPVEIMLESSEICSMCFEKRVFSQLMWYPFK